MNSSKDKKIKFRKVLIANRGEIALRIIKACNALGINTIALYASDDKNRMIDNAADEYIHLPGDSLGSTYLNIDKIIKIAKQRKADAIHPGYGFLAENHLFARACEMNNIAFIGPPSIVLESVADKIGAREIARGLGMQIIPGSDVLKTKKEARAFSREQGYPIILKSCGGGGGKGIRIARNDKELLCFFETAAAEVSSSFGIPRIYAEKYIKARHIEFQFLADTHGNAIHLFERECSIQRRFQKLIEEAPSRPITEKERQKIGSAVCKLAKSVGYTGAGTAEFLLTPERKLYFLEINPRIQVEHGVTEIITGTDIVKEQIRIAQGLPLRVKQKDIRINGHAIECRIVAECARMNFAPAGGIISGLTLASTLPSERRFTRVDTAIYPGIMINRDYDSLLAKVIVWGKTRKDAIRQLRKTLDISRITGVQNTIDFYSFLIRQKSFADGQLSTTFIQDNNLIEKYAKQSLRPEVIALISSLIYEHEAKHATSTKRSRWVENSRKEYVESEPEERWS